MRLLIITGNLGTGGLERISCFVANYFIEKGWCVDILALFENESEDIKAFNYLHPQVRIHGFKSGFNPAENKIKAIFPWIRLIRKKLKVLKPDSILCMTFKIGSLTSIAGPSFKNKIVIREINDPKALGRSQFSNKITEILCRNVRRIIFQTKWEQSCYGKRIKEKGVVIPNPITIDISKCGSFLNNNFFTMSRLLVQQKRQDVLIKAFKKAHEINNAITLEIYGCGPDEMMLKEMIHNFNCESFISIRNPLPNIHDHVINYRGFILSSEYEGMSNALLEAYCLGIPCISSDWPGVEDIITNNIDGKIYKRHNIDDLADCINKIATDDSFCKSITARAINNRTKFETKKVMEEYFKAITT